MRCESGESSRNVTCHVDQVQDEKHYGPEFDDLESIFRGKV